MNHVKGVAYDPEIVDQFEINTKNVLFENGSRYDCYDFQIVRQN